MRALLHGEDASTRETQGSVPGPTRTQKKKTRIRLLGIFKSGINQNLERILQAHKSFLLDWPIIYNNFGFFCVNIWTLSLFAVQLGHMFISWHFYSTPEVPCEYHLTSMKTFFITHHDNAHNNQLHCGEISSPQATSHQIHTLLQLTSYVYTHSPSFLSSWAISSSLSCTLCPTH